MNRHGVPARNVLMIQALLQHIVSGPAAGAADDEPLLMIACTARDHGEFAGFPGLSQAQREAPPAPAFLWTSI